MRIVFLGPPGSGKGTQAKLLSERLYVPAISTGEILRAAVREETPLGREARAVMARGQLVSDSIMIALIRERTARADAVKGFILDGFPRTVEQAEALERLLAGNGTALTAVISLFVPDAVLEERLLSRSGLEGRTDDRPATVQERVKVYREKTEPLIGFYRQRGLLADVNGVGEIPEVSERIHRARPQWAGGPCGPPGTPPLAGGPCGPPGTPQAQGTA